MPDASRPDARTELERLQSRLAECAYDGRQRFKAFCAQREVARAALDLARRLLEERDEYLEGSRAAQELAGLNPPKAGGTP